MEPGKLIGPLNVRARIDHRDGKHPKPWKCVVWLLAEVHDGVVADSGHPLLVHDVRPAEDVAERVLQHAGEVAVIGGHTVGQIGGAHEESGQMRGAKRRGRCNAILAGAITARSIAHIWRDVVCDDTELGLS